MEKDLKKRIDMKTDLEHPWFKKFGWKNEMDDNNNINEVDNDGKSFKKNNTLKNDFGFYTAAVKK